MLYNYVILYHEKKFEGEEVTNEFYNNKPAHNYGGFIFGFFHGTVHACYPGFCQFLKD
ncbi:hypothetical protein GMMP15_30001 [Candidatus Magnetomoraceae bacterium gMMP-15]